MRHRRRAGWSILRAFSPVLAASLLWALVPSAGSAATPEGPPPPPPPPAPQWVAAVERHGNVVLTWVRDRRFRVVRVYRSPAATGGVFVPIGETSDNSFTDGTVARGEAYRYRLTGVGADGREGRPSVELSVRIPTAALRPPAPPVWEGFLPVEGGVGLKWVDQEGADVLVYNVYRRTPPDGDFQLIASVSGTSFIDPEARAGSVHVYVLTALDSSFRETPFSAEMSVLVEKAVPPEERRAAPEWRPLRTRLVALVTAGDGLLVRPVDVAVGPRSGDVYLSDSGRNEVLVFSGSGAFRRSLGGALGSAASFRRLLGLAVDQDETVYAVDAGREAVLAHAGGNGFGLPVGLPSATRQHATGLVDCVAGAGGRLYVVDNTNNRVLVAGPPAAAPAIGSRGFGAGEFSAPTFSAVDPGGNLYVADSLNARVQVFSPDGEFVRAFGRAGRGPQLLLRPKGIAVRGNGDVFVADSWLNAVAVFDAAGRPMAILVDEDGGPLDLGSPNGIALGPGNRVYIAERLSARLQIREIIDEGP